MKIEVRFTLDAEEDLHRLYQFLLDLGDDKGLVIAENAFAALQKGLEYISFSPWGGRRVEGLAPTFRELIVSWGDSGYVLLYEIEEDVITVLAVRHQREWS